MLHVVSWWIGAEILGLAAFPFVFLLFNRLPDRGYTLSKAFGLLLFGYVVWLSASIGFLPNSRGLAVLVLCTVVIASLFIAAKRKDELVAFLRGNIRLVLFGEALFLGLYLLWVVVRAYSPQIQGTEKPMDFAFLNAVLRSESFPPHDPWLSGYPISYYYFGYLLMGSLANLTAVPSAVAFNLAVALLFSLTALGSFGLLYNLASSAAWGSRRLLKIPIPYAAGLTGALFIVGLGNLEGVLELLRAHGLGDGAFWQWVGINGLNNPYNSTHWYPTDNWWWWRATRVIGATVDGRSLDYTITEFPFFSFLLGDLHPHVMALPFVFLALALSLNLLLTGVTPGYAILRGRPFHLLGTALCLGSLGFINSWDYPTYTLVFLGSGLLCWLSLQRGFAARSLINFLGWAAGVVTVSLLLYAPFYWNTGLGLLAVLTPGGNGSDHLSKLPIALWSGPYTRPFHFLLIWALFFFLTGSYIFHRAISRYRHKIITVAAGVSLLILWMAVEWGLSANPQGSEALLLTLAQRGWLLAPLLAIGVTILSRADGRVEGHASPDGPNEAPNVFVGLLIALALVLFLLCETVFLRDVFGNRMNTVFKLYYQAWVLLAVASAFALYYVISWDWGISVAQSLFGKSAWLGIGALLVVGAAIYPVASVRDRTGAFRSATTLDGLDYVSRSDPAEAAAIAWIAANVQGESVVLEATGGEYSEFGRVSSRTGLPTVLGWYGHEVQWRGSDKDFKDRPKDIDAVYSTPDKGQVVPILAKYQISYIYVGSLERRKYPKEALDSFDRYMDVAFKKDGVTIYKVKASG